MKVRGSEPCWKEEGIHLSVGSPSFPHGPVTVPCNKVDGSRKLYVLVRPPGNDGAEGWAHRGGTGIIKVPTGLRKRLARDLWGHHEGVRMVGWKEWRLWMEEHSRIWTLGNSTILALKANSLWWALKHSKAMSYPTPILILCSKIWRGVLGTCYWDSSHVP